MFASPFAIVPCGRSETKLAKLKNRLSSEVDYAASTIPTIVADSMDDESIERMVSQAKVRRTPTYTSVLPGTPGYPGIIQTGDR